MQLRRRFKQTQTLEQRLCARATELREQAQHANSNIDRERLIRLARHAEAASHLNEWLTSPGLQSPK
jgi:hypothetical protein